MINGAVMLKFDAQTTRLIEDAYQGSDVSRRRAASLEALSPRPGERIADIGCGPGLLALELSRAVGPEGEILAIDPSPDMREAASRRCDGRANVRIIDGRTPDLPLERDSVDGAIALQVFEYLDVQGIAAALVDITEALRRGGRLVVGDVHWDTLAWHSEDPARMNRILQIWDGHLAERRVPAILPALMRDAGLVVEATVALPFTDTVCRTDGIARMLRHLMVDYVLGTGQVEPDEAQAWAEEQDRLAAEERFFFHLTHFLVRARKP